MVYFAGAAPQFDHPRGSRPRGGRPSNSQHRMIMKPALRKMAKSIPNKSDKTRAQSFK
jgi:hypothetical protein